MSKRLPYLDTHGLVNGNIPAGESCPFLKECELASSRCPGFVKVKPLDYSCAAARGFSMIKTHKEP